MRPKRRILLVCAAECRLQELRFLLETHAYAVTGIETAAAAQDQLMNAAPFNVLLIDWPLDASEQLVRGAQVAATPSLVVSTKLSDRPAECLADIFVKRCGYQSLELLEWIRTLSSRKRGPKPLKKPVASVPVIEAAREALA